MFQIPNYDPHSGENRFRFTLPRRWWFHRRHYSIPYLQYVPLHVMQEARKSDAPVQLQDICKAVGERAAARAVARLNQPEIAALSQAWFEASAVSLGESVASLNSLKGTGRPSRQDSSSRATG